jgi:hypothetical protein
MAAKDTEKHRQLVSLEYMNAGLQRAKKMPSLRDLLRTGNEKPPSLAEIMARLEKKKPAEDG